MAIKFIILVVCILIGYILGYILTETKYDLQRWELFDFKMFKCRPCLTFHINWVLTTFFSCLFNDLIMIGFGILFSLGMFILMKIDEKERYE